MPANKAFNRLFRYISGANRSREKVAMTLPVPDDPQVTRRAKCPLAVWRRCYSGSWSEKGYRRHTSELESWIEEPGPGPTPRYGT